MERLSFSDESFMNLVESHDFRLPLNPKNRDTCLRNGISLWISQVDDFVRRCHIIATGQHKMDVDSLIVAILIEHEGVKNAGDIAGLAGDEQRFEDMHLQEDPEENSYEKMPLKNMGDEDSSYNEQDEDRSISQSISEEDSDGVNEDCHMDWERDIDSDVDEEEEVTQFSYLDQLIERHPGSVSIVDFITGGYSEQGWYFIADEGTGLHHNEIQDVDAEWSKIRCFYDLGMDDPVRGIVLRGEAVHNEPVLHIRYAEPLEHDLHDYPTPSHSLASTYHFIRDRCRYLHEDLPWSWNAVALTSAHVESRIREAFGDRNSHIRKLLSDVFYLPLRNFLLASYVRDEGHYLLIDPDGTDLLGENRLAILKYKCYAAWKRTGMFLLGAYE